MKKFENMYKEDEGIVSTRRIHPSEWNELNEAMEKINEDARRKEIASYKSAREVYLR